MTLVAGKATNQDKRGLSNRVIAALDPAQPLGRHADAAQLLDALNALQNVGAAGRISEFLALKLNDLNAGQQDKAGLDEISKDLELLHSAVCQCWAPAP
ncbi:MAG: hypothetical protein K2X94_03280 [Amoebophilaceae bacterium]|nr:hypothetical protein [Amoebophilaceae bacterium]